MIVTDRQKRAAARIAWRFAFGAVLATAMAVSALAQTPRIFTPTDESPDDLPAGHGREETFYACTACHGFKIVAQQGMTRAQWDDSLRWMTTKHGMNALEGDDRKLILDYLEAHYPPSVRAGGRDSPNPFLK
jgi:mono/diheme cytochrome c family protein